MSAFQIIYRPSVGGVRAWIGTRLMALGAWVAGKHSIKIKQLPDSKEREG